MECIPHTSSHKVDTSELNNTSENEERTREVVAVVFDKQTTRALKTVSKLQETLTSIVYCLIKWVPCDYVALLIAVIDPHNRSIPVE